MPSIFAGIHIENKTEAYLTLNNIDFDKNVHYLKEEIAQKLKFDAEKLELIYNGNTLEDNLKLNGILRPNGTVHCFQKTTTYPPYQPSPEATSEKSLAKVQELFNVIANVQITVNSRVNILQKILAEYPEFRRNLGAQALIRDSVLFNTLHQPEVLKNIAETYPLICEAAPFIVDTIKKELTRGSSFRVPEANTDSTNSSEEENSIGASGSSEPTRSQTENSRIRAISRQQLQAALAHVGFGSVNSLSNIAQRNTDSTLDNEASGSAPLSNSASGERISSELFRNQLNRAMQWTLLGDMNATATATGAATATATASEQMDTMEPNDTQPTEGVADSSANNPSTGDVPTQYRSHQYAEQLRTMAQMGFLDYEMNIIYLNMTNGNIENAINLLYQ